MKDWRLISDTLASALRRVVPYCDLLPPSAADQVVMALAQYDVAVADQAIVQRAGVKPYCAHVFAREAGRCVGCGESV